jgi:hypothetical protein
MFKTQAILFSRPSLSKLNLRKHIEILSRVHCVVLKSSVTYFKQIPIDNRSHHMKVLLMLYTIAKATVVTQYLLQTRTAMKLGYSMILELLSLFILIYL